MDTSNLKLPDSISTGFVGKTFSFKVGQVFLEPTYLQVGLIIFLLFLLVLTLARLRFLYVHWSLGKSSMAMIFWGFILALIFEGFLLISGRTLLTEILGWKNAPKPISKALDVGRGRLVDVLGTQDAVPMSVAKENPTSDSVIRDFENLSSSASGEVRQYICKP